MSESEVAALGFRLDEIPDPDVGYWPDNAAAISVFAAMRSQWRAGAMGATGLDYNTLPVIFDLTNTPKESQSDVFYDLQCMEDEALRIMQEQRDEIDLKSKNR